MSDLSRPISFQAFCSKTRTCFVVIAEHANDIVTWIGAERSKSPVSSGNAGAMDPHTISGSFVMQVAPGWRCPICHTGTAEGGFQFWTCNRCHNYHCVGLANGKLLGSCGECVFSLQDLKLQERFPVQASEISDTSAAQWRRPANPGRQ